MIITNLPSKAQKIALENLRRDLLSDSNGFIYEDDFHLQMNCDKFLIDYCIDCEHEFNEKGERL